MSCAPIIKSAFLGRLAFNDALALQKTLVNEVAAARNRAYALFLEHPPVITLGRGCRSEHVLVTRDELARRGIEIVECDRGGDVTIHLPGQLVTYLIMPLECAGRNVHRYLRLLEDVGIRTVAAYGVYAEREQGLTGVWAGGNKIMAIGVGFKKWVSYHGIALNIACDLNCFDLIVPCGIRNKGVTSVERETGTHQSVRDAARVMSGALRGVFGLPVEWAAEEEVWAAASRAGS
jgi:lipoyl(octanoyl) transferase